MLTGLGERIRQARLDYGMSQAELARRIGLSKTAMNDLEQGKTRDPHLSYIVAIAQHLRISLDGLVGLGEAPRADATPPAPPKRRRAAAAGA